MESCEENELIGEGRGESVHYWLTETEEVQAEKGLKALT